MSKGHTSPRKFGLENTRVEFFIATENGIPELQKGRELFSALKKPTTSKTDGFLGGYEDIFDGKMMPKELTSAKSTRWICQRKPLALVQTGKVPLSSKIKSKIKDIMRLREDYIMTER